MRGFLTGSSYCRKQTHLPQSADCIVKMCSIEGSFKINLVGQSDPWLSKLLWTLAATAAAWLVSLGGLASIQNLYLTPEYDGEGKTYFR